jgi:peptide/nickel transport system substrate-binding protein
MAALFGLALFDSLYARDDAGQIAPQLAETMPVPEGLNLRVTMRAGLRSGRGRPVESRDAASSIARARASGARAWLADIPAPRIDGASLVFATRDANRLARALASPLVAIVPSSFTPETPDGTGPFRVTSTDDGVVLSRNPVAARGPAYLDEVVVRPAANRAASLKAFESGTDDIGWHGLGYIDPRPQAKGFDFGAVAWVVLFTGSGANDWDAPGVAQSVCDGIPAARLKEFNLGPDWGAEAARGWGGPAGAILVREDCPWMTDLAEALAGTLARPGHELTVKTISASEFEGRRASRGFVLALDVVRPLAQEGLGSLVALATSDNSGAAAALVQRPPKIEGASPRTMTRLLRCGVVGEVRVQGGRVSDLLLVPSSGSGFDLGGSSRAKPP